MERTPKQADSQAARHRGQDGRIASATGHAEAKMRFRCNADTKSVPSHDPLGLRILGRAFFLKGNTASFQSSQGGYAARDLRRVNGVCCIAPIHFAARTKCYVDPPPPSKLASTRTRAVWIILGAFPKCIGPCILIPLPMPRRLAGHF